MANKIKRYTDSGLEQRVLSGYATKEDTEKYFNMYPAKPSANKNNGAVIQKATVTPNAYLDAAGIATDNYNLVAPYFEGANGATVGDTLNAYNLDKQNLYTAYAERIGSLDSEYSGGVLATKNAYKQGAISNKINYDTQRATNQQNLSSAGLIDSGYAYYIGEDLYNDYKNAKAYLDSYEKSSNDTYKTAYGTAIGNAKAQREQGEIGLKEGLKTNWDNAVNAYNTDLNSITEDSKTATIKDNNGLYGTKIINAYSEKFGKDASGIIENLKTANYQYLKTQIDSVDSVNNPEGSLQAWENLDSAYNQGIITKADYQKAYGDYAISLIKAEDIKTQADWDEALNEINKRFESGLINKEAKEKAQEKLNAIDKTKLPKNESEKAVVTAVENVSELGGIITPVDTYDKGVDIGPEEIAAYREEIKEWWENLMKKIKKK